MTYLPSPIHNNVEDILFSKKCGLVSLKQHCFRGEGGSKYKVSRIFAPDSITSKNNETFLVLNIFSIWRSLYPYNLIFYDLSPPSPIHNVEGILFSKKCGLVSLQQHCFRGEGGSKYSLKNFCP